MLASEQGERGVAKSGRTHKIRRAGRQLRGGRNEEKALCFVRTRPRVSAAFGSKAPGTAVPVPAEQNEVARIFVFAKSNDIPGEFGAQRPRDVSATVREGLRVQRFRRRRDAM